MLRGALAAAVTPLRDGASTPRRRAVRRLPRRARGRRDARARHDRRGRAVLARRADGDRAGLRRGGARAAPGRRALRRADDADTVALAEHAADAGADAVAVIAPPYFPLDEEELLAHFEAAARACAPVPFYLYEFEARSGYAIPLPVIERLRERASEPRRDEGLGQPVGAARAVPRSRGSTSSSEPRRCSSAGSPPVPPARSRASPRASPTPSSRSSATGRRRRRRRRPRCAPRCSACRSTRRRRRRSALRGVPLGAGVRAPLRGLTDAERAEVERIVADWQS